MPREKTECLLHTARPEGKGGFGVYSSIVRISLFYGVRDPVLIESEEGTGTRITVRVPVLPQESSVNFSDTVVPKPGMTDGKKENRE
jgi:two-component system sensor histidine kinase YesM